MSRFYVKGLRGFSKTLENAMKKADKNASYTQEDIKIVNENDELVAFRPWWGTEPDEDEDATSIIQFGSFGYYGSWVDEYTDGWENFF